MRLNILTIVLDGMPWITHHIHTFNRLQCDWHWYIVEGAAANVKDTKWCQPQEPRLSNDGTTQYLDGLKSHPRVTVIRKELWEGKVMMVNAPLPMITEPGVLLQVDADELWLPDQLESIVAQFESDRSFDQMLFECLYFVGPNIVTREQKPLPWLRAWRFTPGHTFDKHEPPTLAGNRGLAYSSPLQFAHMSYVLESQVAAKEKFYGYKGAVEQWRRLQANTAWPVAKLTDFLPWAGKKSSADLLIKAPTSTMSEPFAMPSLDEIVNAGSRQETTRPATPPPISASAAHKSRSGPYPKPLVRRFLLVIGFYDGDYDAAVELANLIFDLQKGKNADTDILFYHRNDGRAMAPAIVEKMKLKFLRVFTLKSPRINAKGHPYGCNEMWYALVEMMRQPKWAQDYYAFFNMEPDCTPLCPDWIEQVSTEFRMYQADGFHAIGHIKNTPERHLNGAAVYAADFFNHGGGLNLVGGNANVGYDLYHAKRILPVSVDTPLIGGRWGLTTISEKDLWSYRKDEKTPVVVFHGCKDDSVREAVRKKWLTKD